MRCVDYYYFDPRYPGRVIVDKNLRFIDFAANPKLGENLILMGLLVGCKAELLRWQKPVFGIVQASVNKQIKHVKSTAVLYAKIISRPSFFDNGLVYLQTTIL